MLDKRVKRVAILLLVLLLNSSINLNSSAQELDVAKNFGWASGTKGGFGGKVVRVTNLNSTGKGSFLQAIKTKGKRIIVFEVGGIIDMQGHRWILNDPYVTIMGQTAPSPGITFINGGLIIRTHDVIIQHIRVRTGAEVVKQPLDALCTDSYSYNVIIDHCSFMWAVDENLSASGQRFNGKTPNEWRKNTSNRITFSNNIIGEGLLSSVHEKGQHSMGTLVHDNVSDILIMRNLYTNNNDRNALLKGGSRGVFLNNYIFNPGIRSIWFALAESEWKGREKQKSLWSVVGNVVRLGPSSQRDIALFYAKSGPLSVYLDDNRLFNPDGDLSNNIYKGDLQNKSTIKPIWHNGLQVLRSTELEDYIIKNVGARPWDRDDEDKRIIDAVVKRKGAIISSEREVKIKVEHRSSKRIFNEKEWDLKKLKSK
ncbi:hypothetical protein FAZ19_23205 [Sphingobacterium alkalisoli]|uniref:Uncharacterized protein n=1 Tax=Sphingobacterium alkalisoli TaxID=1874115 RepID=A0A4U0GRE0_9SPHI|nr:hypothetical protein [Sphingobacterium alkalisoli]TJY60162.1 hypothetical protein FAZ19_23205 [Sphingobacterium alkalisoli]GGH32297.1 hypothetical protein GCM10011418_45740 [Sphingobacterium alkalisoli]